MSDDSSASSDEPVSQRRRRDPFRGRLTGVSAAAASSFASHNAPGDDVSPPPEPSIEAVALSPPPSQSMALVLYQPRPPTLIDAVASFIKRAVLAPFRPSLWERLWKGPPTWSSLTMFGGRREAADPPPLSPLGLTAGPALLLPPPSFDSDDDAVGDNHLAARKRGRTSARRREYDGGDDDDDAPISSASAAEAAPNNKAVRLIFKAPRGESQSTRGRPMRGDDGELSAIFNVGRSPP